MEEARKKYLSEQDRNRLHPVIFDIIKPATPAEKYLALLQRFNNSTIKLLLAAAEKENVALRLECLEFDGAWNLQWEKERENNNYIPLIPETVRPAFFGCAISILNNRGRKKTVTQYLEIFSEGPYFCFHAMKALTFECLRSLGNEDKKTEESKLALFEKACQFSQLAAEKHFSPGYYLLAYVYYFSASNSDADPSIYYELAYKMILIAQTLAPHSEAHEHQHQELEAIEKMIQFLSTFFSDKQYLFQRNRAQSTASDEAQQIIAQYFSDDKNEEQKAFMRF